MNGLKQSGMYCKFDLEPISDSKNSDDFDTYDLFYWLLLALAAFGWYFNVTRVPEISPLRAYLVDVIVFAYTNLLALPALLYTSFARKNKVKRFDNDTIQGLWFGFFLSPFAWFIVKIFLDFIAQTAKSF